jgi:hypothetical protein
MKSVKMLWPSLTFRVLDVQLRYLPNGGRYKHFIGTFAFVNQFPMNTAKNYFRVEIVIYLMMPSKAQSTHRSVL